LCWSWTGGRCPVLHLTTYKAQREEKNPQSYLHNSMKRQMFVEMLRDPGGRSPRWFTRFCIIWLTYYRYVFLFYSIFSYFKGLLRFIIIYICFNSCLHLKKHWYNFKYNLRLKAATFCVFVHML
jgi:hypothetical protein